MAGYRGRFAPSPTGPLHAGSLVAALASWLDARAHGGQWLVRIEDVDTSRCIPEADKIILHQLHTCGLIPDAPPVWQSQRSALYRDALDRLAQQQQTYPCACSRKDIEAVLASGGIPRSRNAELVYPGTCRSGLHGVEPRAWRFRLADDTHNVVWTDRRLGVQHQDVPSDVGDFVLLRADGLWAYQLAVVVDDATQGITHIVRGEDLADNTARQILLQQALGYASPLYLHTPLVLGGNGEKLSKQNGAQPLDLQHPLHALDHAAALLGLMPARSELSDALAAWTQQWRSLKWHSATNAIP